MCEHIAATGEFFDHEPYPRVPFFSLFWASPRLSTFNRERGLAGHENTYATQATAFIFFVGGWGGRVGTREALLAGLICTTDTTVLSWTSQLGFVCVEMGAAARKQQQRRQQEQHRRCKKTAVLEPGGFPKVGSRRDGNVIRGG